MGNPSDWEQLSSLLNVEDQVAAFVQNSLGSPSSTVELQLRMESGQAGASSLFPSIKSCLAHAADQQCLSLQMKQTWDRFPVL